MKTYRNLKLLGSLAEQEKLLERVEQLLKNGWTRDKEKEVKLEANNHIKYKVFVCSKLGSRPAANLFFVLDENNYFYVSNIVGGSGIEGYNAILDEFQNEFIEPASNGLDVQINVTSDERTIDNSMSPEMAQLLKRFSFTANKASGGNHTSDEARFFDFIIQAHKEGSLLDESQLKGLLVDDGWTDENAFELSCKYRFGRDLLKQYEETHGY